MLKKMLMRKMLAAQLKNVPEEQKNLFLEAFEKNPTLFENIAKDIQVKVKGGKSQQDAAVEVMQSYQSELAEAFKK